MICTAVPKVCKIVEGEHAVREVGLVALTDSFNSWTNHSYTVRIQNEEMEVVKKRQKLVSVGREYSGVNVGETADTCINFMTQESAKCLYHPVAHLSCPNP